MVILKNGLSKMLEDLLYSPLLPLNLAYVLNLSFSVPKILSDRLLKFTKRFLISIHYDGGDICETIINVVHIENRSCIEQQLQLVLRVQIPALTIILSYSIGELFYVDTDGSFC